MYEITIETVFSAAHALLIAGQREPVHGHDWRVTAAVIGRTLDNDGLLLDFHPCHDALQRITRPFNNADLNRTPPFDRINPSAEHVARYIAESLAAWLESTLPVRHSGSPPASQPPRVRWVRVTEAPGCAVTYYLPASSSHHPPRPAAASSSAGSTTASRSS